MRQLLIITPNQSGNLVSSETGEEKLQVICNSMSVPTHKKDDQHNHTPQMSDHQITWIICPSCVWRKYCPVGICRSSCWFLPSCKSFSTSSFSLPTTSSVSPPPSSSSSCAGMTWGRGRGCWGGSGAGLGMVMMPVSCLSVSEGNNYDCINCYPKLVDTKACC